MTSATDAAMFLIFDGPRRSSVLCADGRSLQLVDVPRDRAALHDRERGVLADPRETALLEDAGRGRIVLRNVAIQRPDGQRLEERGQRSRRDPSSPEAPVDPVADF